MPVTPPTHLPGVRATASIARAGAPVAQTTAESAGGAGLRISQVVVIPTGGETFPVHTFSRLTNMSKMDTESVLLGEIVLGNEPRIKLFADTATGLSRAGIAELKDKLAFLLDSRFRPSDPPTSEPIDEPWPAREKVA
jgi:hypothetical protein